MRLPLILLGLLVLVVYAVKHLKDGPARDKSQGPAAGGGSASANAAALDAVRVFAVFAPVAVMSIAFGKPSLPQQYSAWALLVLQVIRPLAIGWRKPRLNWLLGWLVLALLALLWATLLPFFDPTLV